MESRFPLKDELAAAQHRIRPYVHNTPVMTSTLLNELAGAHLFFKCENLQRMGAFKMRGATNAILSLSEEEIGKGVVTHSSGNFAQALALASRATGCTANIVMPKNAPKIKKEAVRSYGGIVIESESDPVSRERKAEEVRKMTGATFIHPSDDMNVILGNSTAAQELLSSIEGIEILIAPVGGGGLIAGTALAAHYFGNRTVTIGAEPEGADDAFRSLRDGVIYLSENPQTVCDGLRTNLGKWNFPIISKLVSEIKLVADRDTVAAMELLWSRMKIIVEPSAAIALAAVLTNPETFRGKRVGVILSGGNVDFQDACDLMKKAVKT